MIEPILILLVPVILGISIFLGFVEWTTGVFSSIAVHLLDELRAKLAPREIATSLPIETAEARHPPPGLRQIYEELDRDLGIVDPDLLTVPEPTPEELAAVDKKFERAQAVFDAGHTAGSRLTAPEDSGSIPHAVTAPRSVHYLLGFKGKDVAALDVWVREHLDMADRRVKRAEADKAHAIEEVTRLQAELQAERDKERLARGKARHLDREIARLKEHLHLARQEAEAVTRERDDARAHVEHLSRPAHRQERTPLRH